MPEFSVACSTVGAVEVVTVSGEVDLLTNREIEEAIRGCIEGGGAPVVADYSGVTFMDSTGLALLVRTRSRLHREGRRFALATDEPSVRRLLMLSGMEQAIDTHATLDAAVAAAATAA